MENILTFFSSLLDTIFYSVISPLGNMLGYILTLALLRPMQLLQLPPALQVACIAVLTAMVSLVLRKLLKTEEKEQEFRVRFLAQKKEQEELHRISDWKSREKLAKVMDDDIDEDFNSYLAGRFARYGITYLLPMFLVLYWLQSSTGYTIVLHLPGNPLGLTSIPLLVVFLVCYGATLFVSFRLRKNKRVEICTSPSV